MGVAGPSRRCALDDPDREPGQVHLAGGQLSGVLGQLAAQDGAPGLATTVGYPAHDGRHRLGVETAPELVIEKEERLGPLADEVVDAHGHQVDADGAQALRLYGHGQLRPDAVRRSDQHRLVVTGGQGEQASEPADAADHLRSGGTPDSRAYEPDRLLAGVDVHTGGGVGERRLVDHVKAGGSVSARALEYRKGTATG